MEYGKPCRRCLSREACGEDLAKLIRERIAGLPEEMKADEELYRKRLSVCLACKDLIGGMCAKCGCYVEIRAARIQGYCPAAEKKW